MLQDLKEETTNGASGVLHSSIGRCIYRDIERPGKAVVHFERIATIYPAKSMLIATHAMRSSCSPCQAGYSAIVLQIATIGAAKLSFLAFCRTLTPKKTQRRVTIALAVLVCVWFVVSEFTALFQCHLPQTWQYIGGSCIDRVSHAPTKIARPHADPEGLIGCMVGVCHHREYGDRRDAHCIACDDCAGSSDFPFSEASCDPSILESNFVSKVVSRANNLASNR